MEYSIWLSILLHFFNNCILAEVIPWALGKLPGRYGNLVSDVLYYGLSLIHIYPQFYITLPILVVLHVGLTFFLLYAGILR